MKTPTLMRCICSNLWFCIRLFLHFVFMHSLCASCPGVLDFEGWVPTEGVSGSCSMVPRSPGATPFPSVSSTQWATDDNDATLPP